MIKKIVVVLSLISTALPIYVGVLFLKGSWFKVMGAGILLYAALVAVPQIISRRPIALKAVVLLANGAVIFFQVWQLIYEPPKQPWAHLLAIAYPVLTSIALLLLPDRLSLRAFLGGRRGIDRS